MAIYNEILAPRYARMVQKLFGMKGPVPTRQLAGEISIALPLFGGAELRFLEQWNRFGLAQAVAAAAANISCIRMRNPVGSNVIVVLEKIDVSEGGADTNFVLRHGQGGGDLAVVQSQNVVPFDIRLAGTIQPSLVLSQQNTTVAAPDFPTNPNSAGVWQLQNGVTYPIIGTDIQEITLAPGDSLQLNAGVVNQRLVATLWWRERYLEESERQ